MSERSDDWKAGMECAAQYVEGMGFHPTALALRTLIAGGEPCEHCGAALPSHDESCVAPYMRSAG